MNGSEQRNRRREMEHRQGTTFSMATVIAAGVFLLSAVLSSPIQGSAESRLTSRDLNMTFEQGRDAVLTCTVRNIGRKRVVWRKLSHPFPLSVGTTTFWPGGKYRVRRQGDDWRLTVKNLQYQDAGEYECRLSGDGGDVANIMSIIIPGAGRTHFLQTDTTVMTELGSTAVLPCHVKHIRKHLVLWLNKADQVVSLRKTVYSAEHKRFHVLHTTKEEWSLEIKSVKPEDYGVYKCVINTDPFLTRTVTLVEGKSDNHPHTGHSVEGGGPRLILDTFRSEVNVSQYQSATLTCQFQGDPAPTIRWERHVWGRDGTKVVEDLQIDAESYTLTNAQPEDAGIYLCKATNGKPPPEQGKIRVRVTEVVTTTTTAPTTTKFDPYENAAPRVYPRADTVYHRLGSEGHLECRGVGLPRPEVQWWLNGQRIEGVFKYWTVNHNVRHHTIDSHLHIGSVGDDNEGVYRCTAVNRLGSDFRDVRLVVLRD